MQSILDTSSSSSSDDRWAEVSPQLDGAMRELGKKDHAVIVLRFFEGKDLKAVAAAMGVNENAAKVRVFRAMEKLRKILFKRGVMTSAVALGAVIAGNSVQAAPIGLATSVTVAAIKGTGVTASTLTLIKSTIKIMAWTKVKIIAGVSLVAVLAVVPRRWRSIAMTEARRRKCWRESLCGSRLRATKRRKLHKEPWCGRAAQVISRK